MRAYIVRRLLILIPTLFLITFIVFFLVNLIPGDIIDAMRSKALDVQLDRAAIEKELGLDKPKIVQYLAWLGLYPKPDGELGGLLQGDFGVSWWQSLTIGEMIAP